MSVSGQERTEEKHGQKSCRGTTGSPKNPSSSSPSCSGHRAPQKSHPPQVPPPLCRPHVPSCIWDLRLKQVCSYVNKYEVCSSRGRLMAGEAGLDLGDISN